MGLALAGNRLSLSLRTALSEKGSAAHSGLCLDAFIEFRIQIYMACLAFSLLLCFICVFACVYGCVHVCVCMHVCICVRAHKTMGPFIVILNAFCSVIWICACVCMYAHVYLCTCAQDYGAF